MLSVPGGDTTAGVKQRLEAFVRRAVRAGLYPADGPNVQQLVTNSNDAVFGRIQANEHYVLQQPLPDTTNHQHGLRNRRHNYTLNTKTVTGDRNFLLNGYFLKTCIDYCSIHSLAVLLNTFIYRCISSVLLFIKRRR